MQPPQNGLKAKGKKDIARTNFKRQLSSSKLVRPNIFKSFSKFIREGVKKFLQNPDYHKLWSIICIICRQVLLYVRKA